MTEETKNQEQEQQDSQGSPKKVLPQDVQQVSLKEYEELRKKELEKRKKKKKAPPIISLIFNIIYFILAAFGVTLIGYFGFALLTAPAK